MTQQFPAPLPALRIVPPDARPQFDARKLTGAGSTAEIVLDDKIYTLRITRAGKLILTK